MSPTEFEHIYTKYQHRVYNTVLSYLQQAEDAEEVTQDVFVEAFHSMESFKGESAIGTWIYRIAVNKSLDFLRHKNRQKRFAFFTALFHPQTDELLHDPPDFYHPGIALENKEKAATLFKTIRTLPETQQTAFILTQVEDLSYAEAAEVMNITVAALESLLHRAKQNLRKRLSHLYKE
ncbi:RNA polymerase sigma factor [Runella slithyformis]|uniref:RNA polymerase sigma factor n=1 Tax=Runella slithyformis (strain ATCC 29530 / DSM 19594 / LMG 11500 / NCIMB 11436 / LSU 4) TaxID=761193 RepID=A0A7U4E4X1_RUNSL|nr:RNA polymerase sigma factor [Runella slithyformis]AEI47883.1 RNA polymerase, sigma-24 subunit, ECF subfamily [Runella slithyformis DSM 19594]